jgi:hypothetical protein
MKNEEYHTVRAVPTHVHESNRKIVETKTKYIPLKHIYTCTSKTHIYMYLDCFIPFLFYFENTSQLLTGKRELGIKDLTCNPTYTLSSLMMESTSLFLYPSSLERTIQILFYFIFIGYLICTSIHTKNVISQVHLNAQQTSFPKCLKD